MVIQRQVTLTNRDGLHIRVGVKLVEEARKFECEILLCTDTEEVNSKDILSVLSLGAVQGTVFTLKGSGDDAEQAVAHIESLFLNEFNC